MIEIAILAGGCFWGMEHYFGDAKLFPGVVETKVGYVGGSSSDATYDHVKKGNTGHAESLEVKFDSTKTSYRQVLNYFFAIHDPTTLDRQHGDVGTQYRSEIFVLNPAQKKIAETLIQKMNERKVFGSPVVTKVSMLNPSKEVPAGLLRKDRPRATQNVTPPADAPGFFAAESYHQKYLDKNPGGYNCHRLDKGLLKTIEGIALE